jgi:hypothetical protein
METDFQVSGKSTYGVEAAIRANLIGSITRENIRRYEFFPAFDPNWLFVKQLIFQVIN